MDTLHTLGYARWDASQVKAAAESLNALLVDTRLSARSGKPGFNAADLREAMPKRYVHLPEFGNVNYKGGPIQIDQFAAGRVRLGKAYAEEPYENIILMCGCANAETCHRTEVAERLAARRSLEVKHLASPKPQTPLEAQAEAVEKGVEETSYAPRVREIITKIHPDDSLIVWFTKRGNGKERRMECIWRSKRNPDSKMSYEPSSKDLCMVWDKEKGDPRMVSLTTTSTIISVRTGEVYEGRALQREAMGEGLDTPREDLERLTEEMEALF